MTSPAPLQGGMVGDQLRDQSCDLQGEGGRTAPVSDPVRLALLIANAIRQAVYGGDGPLGKPIVNGRERQ